MPSTSPRLNTWAGSAKRSLGFFTDEPGFMNEGTALDDASTSSFIGQKRLGAAVVGRACPPPTRCAWRSLPSCTAFGRARQTAPRFATPIWTLLRLYRSCFDEQIGDWCRAHGVMHIGHVIEDKSCHTRLGQGAGHYFRAVAGQDMAGVDVVINQLAPGIDRGRYSYFHGAWNMEFFTYALAKLGSSAARLDPKKQGRCMAEVFGALGWHEGLREMKWIADHMLVPGINCFTPHAFSMAPFPDWDFPAALLRARQQPAMAALWPAHAPYESHGDAPFGRRCRAPVAILYHADAPNGPATPCPSSVAAELTRAQIDFDFVPAEL